MIVITTWHYFLITLLRCQSSGVTFSQRPEVLLQNHSTSDSGKSNSSNGEVATTGHDRSAPPTVPQTAPQTAPQVVPESRYVLLNS